MRLYCLLTFVWQYASNYSFWVLSFWDNIGIFLTHEHPMSVAILLPLIQLTYLSVQGHSRLLVYTFAWFLYFEVDMLLYLFLTKKLENINLKLYYLLVLSYHICKLNHLISNHMKLIFCHIYFLLMQITSVQNKTM